MSQTLIEPGHGDAPNAQQSLEVPQVTSAFQQDNRFFVKTYLLDDSINKNRWGVKPEYISKHIMKFEGKPLLLTPDTFHPHEFEHVTEDKDHQKNIDEYKRLQEKYVIGKILNVNLHQGSNAHYNALIEITDAKAIQSFKEGKVPLYVSPSIYRLNPQDPSDAITDYEPIHVAIVDNPAFGAHKANIRAQCQGDIVGCSRMLSQAGSVSSSDGLGSFCISNTLSKIKNIFNANTLGHISSYTDSDVTNKVSTMENSSNTNNNPVSDQVVVTTTMPDGKQVVEQKAPQQQEQKSENRAPISPPVSPVPEPKGINPPGSEEQREESEGSDEEVAKLRAELKAQKEELGKEINSLKEFKANLEKQSQETQALAKRTKIESSVPKDFADSIEAREEAIAKFMNIPDAELDFVLTNFVATPCSKGVRQAGVLRKQPRVSDFIDKKTEDKNVKQAGTSNEDIEMMQTMLKFGGLSS